MREGLRALSRVPGSKRSARIWNIVRNKIDILVARVVYSTFGYWLNRTRSRYLLEFRPDFHCDFDQLQDYKLLLKLWLAGNRSKNCGDLTRFYALCLNVEHVLKDGVPGDLVELGVYKGNSAGVLTTLGRRYGRHTFLFDSFGGFDDRDLQGVDRKQGVQFKDTSLESVRNLIGAEGVTYVQGFFPESASNFAMPQSIAVAHIDCDLYAPMRAGLESFYPRLSPGGIMLLHDYSSGHWPGATRAIDEFFSDLPEKPVILPDKSGTAVVRKMIRA